MALRISMSIIERNSPRRRLSPSVGRKAVPSPVMKASSRADITVSAAGMAMVK